VQAWAAAAEGTKSLKVDDLSKWLKSHKVDTVIGTLGWDKKGDILNPEYVFYVWKDGSYKEL
jgi:branched-chain amino acid transport system substrate-binding protein